MPASFTGTVIQALSLERYLEEQFQLLSWFFKLEFVVIMLSGNGLVSVHLFLSKTGKEESCTILFLCYN